MKIRYTPSFKRALKKYKKKHYPLDILDECVTAIIANDKKRLKLHHAHKLTNYFELHITANWLLIYDFNKNNELILILIDLGDHDDLNKNEY